MLTKINNLKNCYMKVAFYVFTTDPQGNTRNTDFKLKFITIIIKLSCVFILKVHDRSS